MWLAAALDLDRLLATDYWGTPITAAASHKSYRPLTVLTVWLNHRAHGLDVRGYHVVNVLLHALASVLVFYVAKAIMRIGAPAGVSDRAQHPTAAWAALLFAVHPVHVEAVANVAGRAELLSACFYLATFLAASQWRSGAQGKVTLEHTSQAATWPRMCFRLAVTVFCWSRPWPARSLASRRWSSPPQQTRWTRSRDGALTLATIAAAAAYANAHAQVLPHTLGRAPFAAISKKRGFL